VKILDMARRGGYMQEGGGCRCNAMMMNIGKSTHGLDILHRTGHAVHAMYIQQGGHFLFRFVLDSTIYLFRIYLSTLYY